MKSYIIVLYRYSHDMANGGIAACRVFSQKILRARLWVMSHEIVLCRIASCYVVPYLENVSKKERQRIHFNYGQASLWKYQIHFAVTQILISVLPLITRPTLCMCLCMSREMLQYANGRWCLSTPYSQAAISLRPQGNTSLQILFCRNSERKLCETLLY